MQKPPSFHSSIPPPGGIFMLPEIERFQKWLKRKAPHASTQIHYTNDLELFFAWLHKLPQEVKVQDGDRFKSLSSRTVSAFPSTNRCLNSLNTENLNRDHPASNPHIFPINTTVHGIGSLAIRHIFQELHHRDQSQSSWASSRLHQCRIKASKCLVFKDSAECIPQGEKDIFAWKCRLRNLVGFFQFCESFSSLSIFHSCCTIPCQEYNPNINGFFTSLTNSGIFCNYV
jgi:hypothetical protein